MLYPAELFATRQWEHRARARKQYRFYLVLSGILLAAILVGSGLAMMR